MNHVYTITKGTLIGDKKKCELPFALVFEENGVSPNESLGPQMITLESLIKKRINGVIAIVKDIEKNQTKPTVAMLHALFQETTAEKKPLLLEKKEITQVKPFKYQEKKDNNSQ